MMMMMMITVAAAATTTTRNTSGDERELSLRHCTRILQNTIDSCINSATDRRGYVLERMFTEFSEVTQYNGHYAV